MLTGSKISSSPQSQKHSFIMVSYSQICHSIRAACLHIFIWKRKRKRILTTYLSFERCIWRTLCLRKRVKLLCTNVFGTWHYSLVLLSICTCAPWCKMVQSFRSKRLFLWGHAACKKRVKQKRKASRFYLNHLIFSVTEHARWVWWVWVQHF